MHLPCPSCSTTYDVDLNVYTPGTAFQCVGCQAIITVPTRPAAAQDSEDDIPGLDAFDAADHDVSPTVDFTDSMESIDGSIRALEEEASQKEAEESLAVLDDIFPSSPEADIASQAHDTPIPSLDLDPFEEEGPSTVDFAEEPDRIPEVERPDVERLAPEPAASEPLIDRSTGSMSGALDASFLDELMPRATPEGEQSLESLGQALDNQESAIDLTSDLHAASLLDDSSNPTGPSGDESIPNLMDELSDEIPGSSALGASINDFTPGSPSPMDDSLNFDFDEFNEPLGAGPADSQSVTGTKAHAIAEEPGYNRGEEEDKSSGRQVGMFIVLVLLAGVAAAVSLDLKSMLGLEDDSAKNPPTAQETLEQEKISEAIALKKAQEAKREAEAKQRAAQRGVSRENVDTLRFSELTSAMASNVEDPALKAWADYRLVNTYGETPNRESAPIPALDESNDFSVALEGSRLLDAKDGEAARKLLERVWRSRKAAAPATGLVLAKLYAARDMTKKAESVLTKVVAERPSMIDARLALGELKMQGSQPSRGARVILQGLTEETSTEHLLLRLRSLLAKGRFSEASAMAEGRLNIGHGDKIAPPLQATSLAAGAYVELLHGKTTQPRLRISESNASPTQQAIEQARISTLDGKNGIKTLRDYAATLPADATAQKAQVVYVQSQLQIAAGDLDSARQSVESIASLPPKLTQGWLQLARGKMSAHGKRMKQARSAFKAALKVRPVFPEAQVALELAANRRSKDQLARLSRLHRANRHPVISIALADAMLRRGNHHGAIALYEEVLWSAPASILPGVLLDGFLNSLTHAQQFQRALKLGRSRYESSGKKPELAERMAQIADTFAQPAGQLFWHSELDRAHPFTHKTVLARSRALLALDRRLEARLALEDFLKEKPDWRTAEVTKQLARTWTVEDGVKARAFLKESIRSKPAPDTYILLGELEEQRSNRSNAIDAYQEALKLNPQLVDVRAQLAHLLLKNGQLSDAANQLKFVTTHSPKNAEAREQLGDIYAELGKPRLALDAYLNTLRYGDITEKLLLKAAKLQLYELAHLPPAVRTLNRVLQINPENPVAHYLIGVALKDQDQLQVAKAHFNRYLALAPKGEYAQEVRSELANLGTR